MTRRRATASRPQSDRRVRELARIHVNAKQLGLDRDTYVALVERVSAELGSPVSSSADLDDAGRRALIRELSALADRLDVRLAGANSRHGRQPNTLSRSAHVKKIEALLADAGRPWAYAESMCKRMLRRDRIEFCTDYQLRKLVAALSIDQRRRDKAEEASR
jgi:phage gp16-like protein